MKNKLNMIVEAEEDGLRIDKLISVKYNNFTRSKIQKLCYDSMIIVNKLAVGKNYKVKKNDVVEILLEFSNNQYLIAQDLKLIIHYKDDYIAIVEKPKGMLTHPDSHQNIDTLVNGLLYIFGNNLSNLAGSNRLGIVHRLDKDTSGLLIIALNNEAHSLLNQQMINHEIRKYYKAVVYGELETNDGIIELPIGRNPAKRIKMAVVENGRKSITKYRTINIFSKYSLVELELLTGRTHQIRVHMQAKGNPITGDRIYHSGHEVIKSLNGQCLHACKLSFIHPILNTFLEIESELPDYFTNFINSIS